MRARHTNRSTWDTFLLTLTLSEQIFRSFLTEKVAAAGRNWISVTSQVNREKCRSWKEHVHATLCACMHVFIHAALRKIDHINVKKYISTFYSRVAHGQRFWRGASTSRKKKYIERDTCVYVHILNSPLCTTSWIKKFINLTFPEKGHSIMHIIAG